MYLMMGLPNDGSTMYLRSSVMMGNSKSKNSLNAYQSRTGLPVINSLLIFLPVQSDCCKLFYPTQTHCKEYIGVGKQRAKPEVNCGSCVLCYMPGARSSMAGSS
jgi:hypothetical protein